MSIKLIPIVCLTGLFDKYLGNSIHTLFIFQPQITMISPNE